MEQDYHLIKANIALFEGALDEVRRLLGEYDREHGPLSPDHPEAPLVLWLRAQSQNDPAARAHILEDLLALPDQSNQYVRLAQNSRHIYSDLAGATPQSSRRRPLILFLAIIVPGIAAAIVLVTTGALSLGESPATESVAEAQPTAPPLPDRSRALVADSFTARYPAGILQVSAIEDGSERVVDTRSGTPATPVLGARFYALRLIFECRSGICSQPPQANLTVVLDNGEFIAANSSVQIAGERVFEPIALGRTTTGWVVFELPAINSVRSLVVSAANDGEEFDPLAISLQDI